MTRKDHVRVLKAMRTAALQQQMTLYGLVEDDDYMMGDFAQAAETADEHAQALNRIIKQLSQGG